MTENSMRVFIPLIILLPLGIQAQHLSWPQRHRKRKQVHRF